MGNVKTIVSKLATDHPKEWHKYLPMAIWCLQEPPNRTTGLVLYTLVMGHLPRGPLPILKDSWCGEKHLPVSFGKNATEYLRDLHENFKLPKLTLLHPLSMNKRNMLLNIIYVVAINISKLVNKYRF